jgi:hypothetical protein
MIAQDRSQSQDNLLEAFEAAVKANLHLLNSSAHLTAGEALQNVPTNDALNILANNWLKDEEGKVNEAGAAAFLKVLGSKFVENFSHNILIDYIKSGAPLTPFSLPADWIEAVLKKCVFHPVQGDAIASALLEHPKFTVRMLASANEGLLLSCTSEVVTSGAISDFVQRRLDAVGKDTCLHPHSSAYPIKNLDQFAAITYLKPDVAKNALVFLLSCEDTKKIVLDRANRGQATLVFDPLQVKKILSELVNQPIIEEEGRSLETASTENPGAA